MIRKENKQGLILRNTKSRTMIKNSYLALFTILCSVNTFGQHTARYGELIEEAEHLYDEGEYLGAGQKYSEAFMISGDESDIFDRYKAACSWALANEVDSSFVHLFIFAQKLFSPENIHSAPLSDLHRLHNFVFSDSDLNILHIDDRWKEIDEIIELNKEIAESKLDMELVLLLDTILEQDQKSRLQMEEIAQTYGWESEEMKALLNTMHETDSLNQVRVKSILDNRGWPGADVIGYNGNLALWLVIQHADLELQLQYLPMMRAAVKQGNARPQDLAYLEDRVALRQGQKQIYGSQIWVDQETGEYYVSPLIDPDNVDKRRSEVGLNSLQEYISHWRLIWDVEEYKKLLPEIEAKQKK